jgi:hypothetical protein
LDWGSIVDWLDESLRTPFLISARRKRRSENQLSQKFRTCSVRIVLSLISTYARLASSDDREPKEGRNVRINGPLTKGLTRDLIIAEARARLNFVYSEVSLDDATGLEKSAGLVAASK